MPTVPGVDPSIILSAQYPTAQSVAAQQQMQYRNQLAQLQVGQAQQEAQQRNALLDIFKQPGAMDERGMPTQATVGRVMQANPDAGLQLQNNLARFEEQRQQAITQKINQRLLGMNIAENHHTHLVDIATGVQDRYDTLIENGTSPAEAARIAGQERNQAVQDAQKEGILLPEQAAQLQGPFNPEINRAFISGSKQYRTILQERHQAKQEQLATAREDRLAAAAEETPFMKELAATYGKGSPEYSRALKDRVVKQTGGIEDTTLESVAKAIANYDEPPMSGNALRIPANAKIMARVKEMNPDYNAQDYKSRQTALTAFTSGKQGNTVRSLNVVMDHLDALGQLGDALKNGNIQSFNRISQAIASQTGQPAPTNFDAAKKIVADEVVKSIVGAGGGVSDREEAAKAFDKVSSPAQLAGAITTAKRLMRGQLKGLQRQYETSTGRKDFEEKFLTGEVRSLESGAKGGKAPQAAINYLKAHPEAKDQFKAKYGYLPD